MVSSGTVSGDASTLNGYLNTYKSEMSGLDGSWKGPSYDSISSQAESFFGEYSKVVTQMTSFSNACAAYEKYISLKAEIKQTEADRANAADEYKSTYDTPLAQMNRDLSQLKTNIENYLNEASTPSLTATPVTINITSIAPASSGSTDNQSLIDAILGEDGNTISDYSGLGFHDGEWCADFVSQKLIENGYDIERSSLAGDGDGTIFGSLRASGATIHLDTGSWAHPGCTESDEYDPDYSPQPGDVVVFDWYLDGVNDHTGFVVQDNGDGTITTIEGNTDGAAGGSCVAIKTRDRSNIYGYATPVKSSD